MDRRTPPKLVDFKMPATWIISSFFVVVLFMGGMIQKLDSLATNVEKLETKLDSREDKLTAVLTGVTEIKAENKIQQSQIDRNVTELLDIRRDVQELKVNKQAKK